MRNRTIAVLAGLLSTLLVLGLLPSTAEATVYRRVNPHYRSTVVDVVDGDTIHVAYGHGMISVRLIGINAPEIRHGSFGTNQCGGLAAATKLRSLLHPGTRVTLTRPAHHPDFDSWGRALRYVALRGGDVNGWMVWTGYARAAYDYGSYGSHPRRAFYHSIDWRHNISRCKGLRQGAPFRGYRPLRHTTPKAVAGDSGCGPDPFKYSDYCPSAGDPYPGVGECHWHVCDGE